MGLDIVELFMDVEQAFDIEIPNAAAAHLETVGALFDHIRSHLGTGAEAPVAAGYAGELWERYLDVVAKSTDVPRSELRPEASFVKDVGLD